MNIYFARRLRVLAVSAVSLLTSCVVWANTALWIGNPGVTASTNWSDNANWNNSSGGSPGFTNNDVVFGGAGSVGSANSVNNVVDSSGLVASMAYTNGPSQFQTTLIPADVTLTNAYSLNVGNKIGDLYSTVVDIVGGGTLVHNGTNVDVRNNGNTVNNALATLDLSGLSNFITTASAGVIGVAAGTANRSGGVLTLAGGSNSLTADTINFATGSGLNAGPSASRINLGFGTNILNVGSLNIASAKNTGTVQFKGATGGLRLRGVGGTDSDRANLTIGNRAPQGGTGTTTGNLSLNGHPVDIKVGTMILGLDTMAGGNAAVGTVSFDTGTLDATTISMGIVSNAAAIGGVGTINVGANATLVIGAGGMSMVNQIAGNGVAGNLNVTGGSVQVGGSIRKASAAGVATITISAGNLMLGGATNTIGTATIPIDALNLTDSSFTLPAQIAGPGVVVAALNLNGATDTINLSSVPVTSSFPTQYPLIAYGSLNGTYDFVLGTLPGTYQGYLSNNAASFSVDLVLTGSLVKPVTWNGNLSPDWDTTTFNWLFAGNPANYQQGDQVTFDDSLTGVPNVNLTTALSPGALVISNALSSYSFSGVGKISGVTSLVKQGLGSLTLAETGGDDFSGGITVNGGTLLLDNAGSLIAGGLAINDGLVQIGDNDVNGVLPSGAVTNGGALIFKRTDSVTVATAIAGVGSIAQQGSGILTLTGANTYSGSTIVGNGALALSGSGTIANSALIMVESAMLDVSAVAIQPVLASLVVSNATTTVALMAGGSASIAVNNLSLLGPTNYINVTSFPPFSSYPVTFTIIQSATPVSGGFNLGVGSLPVGVPSYVANATLSPDQTAVRLTVTSGPISARPFVLWSGADVPNLNTNWSDNSNWQLPGAPGGVDNVIFNAAAATSSSALSTPGGGAAALLPDRLNNLVDADFAISTLTYTNLGGAYQNTFINSGHTLSVTNAGGFTIGALDAAGSTELATISGANGKLQVANSNANIQVWVGSATGGGSLASLDLSALDNFNASCSRLLVGATISNVVNRPSGTLYLARTNSISAAFQTASIETGTLTGNAAITIGDCNQSAGPDSFVWLGQVNSIGADTISIGRQKAVAHLQFNPIYANIAPFPSVAIQGYSSGLVSVLNIGDGVGNTGATTFHADANLEGGVVTADVDTINIGRASSGGTGAATSTGTLSFDAGTISVNTLNIGLQPASNQKSGVGTNNVGSNLLMGLVATLIVRSNLNLGATPSDTASTLSSGTLNLTNGTVLANNITAGTNATSIVGIYGGRLAVSNNLGIPGAPLGVLDLAPLGTPDNVVSVLELNASATPAVTVTTLNLDGRPSTFNLINIASAPPTTNAALPLIQYTSLNVLNGTFNLSLGSLPAGYDGYLTNDVLGRTISVVLIPVSRVRPFVRWSGADVPDLNTNWSDKSNWELPGAPGGVDNVIFGTNATVSSSALSTPGGGAAALLPDLFNNLMDIDRTISSLTYTNLGGAYHNTYILNGQTLNVTNAGGFNVGALDATGASEFVTISGANGKLHLANTNAGMQVWLGSSTGGGSQSSLDLSALGNLEAAVSQVLVGATISNVVNRPSGVLYLARTNLIATAFQTTSIESDNAALTIGSCIEDAGPDSFVWLGQVNSIAADTIAIGRQKAGAHLQFNPTYLNLAPFPSVTLQGYSSGLVSVLNVGDGVGDTDSASFQADANLRGGVVTANVDTLNLGRASSGGAGAATSIGTLSCDAGTITVNTLNVGLQPAANLKAGVGTNNVGSNTVMGVAATMIVRSNLNLGATPFDTASTLTAGTLNLTNGTVLANNITAGTNATSIVGIYGGRLVVSNNLGIAGAPLGTLELAPLGTPDNSISVLQLNATTVPAVTVTSLNLDGRINTTNLINIASALPTTNAALPLIKYTTLSVLNGTFNLSLGALPPGYSGYLTNDATSGTISIVLAPIIRSRPVITDTRLQFGTNLVSSGTNGVPNGIYYVLSAASVNLALDFWIPIATNQFDANGGFIFTNLVDWTKRRRFFQMQVP